MPAAIGIIYNPQKNNVLLVKRADVNVWVLPGGGIDPGETSQQAVVREVLEETGLATTVEGHVAHYSPINRLSEPTDLYICKAIGGTLQTSDESRAAHFFSLDSLPNELFFVHRDFLKDAETFCGEVIKKNLDQVTYLALLLYFLRDPLTVLRFAKTILQKKNWVGILR